MLESEELMSQGCCSWGEGSVELSVGFSCPILFCFAFLY